MMTPNTKQKLTVQRQTLRVLAGADLTHVRGGQGDAIALDSEATCGPTTKSGIEAPTVRCGPG